VYFSILNLYIQGKRGPLVTKDGKVLGINTWKVAGPQVEGVGFANPINVALKEFERHLGQPLKLD